MSIVLGVAVVLVLLAAMVLITAFRRPAEFRVERSIETSAPADLVFAIFSDLGRWRDWSPYDGRDPSMHAETSEPSHGVGAWYIWDGNNKVGEGKLTIRQVDPGRSVDLDLAFSRPFQCQNHVQWRVDDEGVNRRIVWAMDGRNDGPMPRIMSVLMDMDKMCGKDFEAGLATLKALVEQPRQTGVG